MVASGLFWEEALPDIDIISKRLLEVNRAGILARECLKEQEWKELQMLWETPYLLYEENQKSFMYEKESLQNMIQYLKDSEIIIFGCGQMGVFLHAQFLARGYHNVIAYCDNNAGNYRKQQYGIDIFYPEQAVRKFDKAKYVVANKYHAEDMKRQLQLLGIKDDNIKFCAIPADMRLFGEKFI